MLLNTRITINYSGLFYCEEQAILEEVAKWVCKRMKCPTSSGN